AAASTGRRLLQGQQPALAGRRVLIVDDNATNQRILSGQVRSWGMTPTCAASGGEALSLIRDGVSFDVALLDMQMPEMDGQRLAEALAERCPRLPLVLCSSIGHQPDLPKDLFAASLTKPIKQAQLYRTLVQVLGDPSLAPVRASQKVTPVLEPDEMALRILVAEDNPVNQKVALMLLKRLGYRADVAANGIEALQAVRQIPYDVVLMDVRMPEMDGLEATRRIVAEWPDEQNRPCVVALTADVTRSKQEECKAAGMKGFLTKPVDRDQLAYVIEQCVKRKAARATAQRQAATPESSESSVDTETSAPVLPRLKEMVRDDNPDLLLELLVSYLEDLPSYLEQMASALASGDTATVGAVAHTLKSSSALMDADKLSDLCRDLEACCDRGITLDALAVKVAQVQKESRRAQQHLTAIAGSLQSNPAPAAAPQNAATPPARPMPHPSFPKTAWTERA
ncbi:MAG: response regulator, partial [Rhodothermales bacterium]